VPRSFGPHWPLGLETERASYPSGDVLTGWSPDRTIGPCARACVAVQGTIMLVLAPLVGIHLTPVLVVQMICLELLMAVAMTTFGVFVASRIQKMESFQVVMQMRLMATLFLSGALFPAAARRGFISGMDLGFMVAAAVVGLAGVIVLIALPNRPTPRD